MTTKTERRMPTPERAGTAESIARSMTERELEQADGMPCCVRHEDAGGHCERTATAMVYGLLFCGVHGEEARLGALSELFMDAGDCLERLENPYNPIPNAEAEKALKAAMRAMDDRVREREEEAAVRRAYPTIPGRVCTETALMDYGAIDSDSPREFPVDVYRDSRRLLHKLMRLAFGEGEDWLVEELEAERESASAQLAFALEDYERKAGPPE